MYVLCDTHPHNSPVWTNAGGWGRDQEILKSQSVRVSQLPPTGRSYQHPLSPPREKKNEFQHTAVQASDLRTVLYRHRPCIRTFFAKMWPLKVSGVLDTT